MNNLNKYEKILAEKLRELPLPDEEAAWQDMKRRLDEDKRPFILPLRFGCAFLSLLFAVAITGVLYSNIFPLKKSKKQSNQQQSQIPDNIKTVKKSEDKVAKNNENNSSTSTQLDKDSLSHPKNSVIQFTLKENNNKEKFITTISKSELAVSKNIVTDNSEDDTYVKELADSYFDINEKPVSGSTFKIKTKKNDLETVLLKQTDSIATVQKKSDSISVAKPEKKKKKKEIQKINFSTGLALWQRIDNIGPKPKNILFPNGTGGSGGAGNSSNSKNNKLLDYVPSIYARMYKGNKWFLQTEFRYRAPQYERDLLYSQKGVPGPFGNATATKIVTKTYYHQVPVTFNYFITKNWSIGAGIIWNKFNRAVTVEQIRAVNPSFPQRDTLLSTKLFDVIKADSNFVKYYFQGVIESQYRWRRFSLGIRYAAAPQPYLKFTLPGGAEQREKNSSLQLFLRYELWKSKN